MFAHDHADLPENLLPDDVADLLAGLGYRADRRNITRALEAADIPGVTRPATRAQKWIIPTSQLCDVVAAVLQRRELRAAAPGWRPVGSLDRYRLPAARMLMQRRELAKYVPPAVRRQIQAEEREREKAGRQRIQDRLDEEERDRQADERHRAAAYKRIADFATMHLYFEFRCRAMEARCPRPRGEDFYQSPAYAAFAAEWPDTSNRPTWWRLPPEVLEAAVKLLRPWLNGKAKMPSIEHLLSIDVDYTKPWPWRADTAPLAGGEAQERAA